MSCKHTALNNIVCKVMVSSYRTLYRWSREIVLIEETSPRISNYSEQQTQTRNDKTREWVCSLQEIHHPYAQQSHSEWRMVPLCPLTNFWTICLATLFTPATSTGMWRMASRCLACYLASRSDEMSCRMETRILSFLAYWSSKYHINKDNAIRTNKYIGQLCAIWLLKRVTQRLSFEKKNIECNMHDKLVSVNHIHWEKIFRL